jgi:hypothetical protein
MVKEQAGKWVVPNPQIPRSFGLMNITFGALLLLAAIGYGVTYAYAPIIQKQFSMPMNQLQEKQKSDRAAKIAELKAQENAAKTAEEKKSLAEERAAVEARVVPDLSAFDELQNLNAYNEPRLAIYYILDVSTAVILNILMIVAGAGLMGLREWGRRLAIWVAQLKILRWFAMVVGSMVVIVPITMERTQKAMAALEAQIKVGGRGALPFSLSGLTRWSLMAGVVFMIFAAIVASVYPAMMWWYLSRPAARAACLKKRPEPELSESGPQWETTV